MTTSLITYQQSLLKSITSINTNLHELTTPPAPLSPDTPEHQGRNRGKKEDGVAGAGGAVLVNKDEGRSPFLYVMVPLYMVVETDIHRHLVTTQLTWFSHAIGSPLYHHLILAVSSAALTDLSTRLANLESDRRQLRLTFKGLRSELKGFNSRFTKYAVSCSRTLPIIASSFFFPRS